MKGIILAGGSGTRLKPLTNVVSKQLLPVYDKPMIYYPISVLMLSGIRDILIITTKDDLPVFQRVLGNGDAWGIRLRFIVQPNPEGLAQAFILGEEFIDGGPCTLVLGDNVFAGAGLQTSLLEATNHAQGATVFAYQVQDPQRYGIVTFDEDKRATALEEKPKAPTSDWAVTGIYFYDERIVDFAKRVRPSERGELEITDINKMYLEAGDLRVRKLPEGLGWFDTGTPDSLLKASEFVRALEARQAMKVCCPEEIAFEMGYIDQDQLRASGTEMPATEYGRYLIALSDKNRSA